MTLFCFYQKENKGVWHLSLASERHNLVKTRGAKLITALDVDNDFSTSLSQEESATVKQYGDLFFDFDDDLDVCISQFKKFLVLLQSKNVDLDQIRIYATGGRGFHCFIPMQMYMPKVAPGGVASLVHIYREMAQALWVDSMDGRIYSAKKGRQLRCVNVQRDGVDGKEGTWKVPITSQEALNMTEELYWKLTASPRNEPPLTPPTFNPDLALIYATSQDKVSKAVAKRRSKKNKDEGLAKFGGKWPDTLSLICSGVGIREDVGFNSIAMQVAITGCALGMKSEQIIADCAGLIDNHKGDSSRYGTPAKRKAFLREMVAYVEDSPLYDYSAGGILSILDPALRANADISFGEWSPEETSSEPVINEDGTVQEPPEPEEETGPIKVDRSGIFVRTDNGYNKVSDIGIGRAIALKRMDGQDMGYEADIFKHGKPLGAQILSMDKLSSRAAFQSFTSQWSASMGASDIQTAKIMDVLGRRAERNKDITYLVDREGVDLVIPQGSKSEDDFEMIWSSPATVIGNKGGKYRFRNPLDKHGAFQSDLMDSPELTIDDAELIENLLQMNTTKNLGKLLGWFCVVPMTQIIRRFHRQFPILQVFGQSGAGKSKTTSLLNHLWYYMKDPKELQAQGTTNYALLNVVASSASQPVVFEEVKAREMNSNLRNFLLNILRCNYDGFSISRGALSKDSGAKDVVVNSYGNVGPIAFVGESVENQSALLERCVVVSLSKSDRYGRDMHYHFVKNRATELGKLGRALVATTMASNIRQVRAEIDEIFQGVKVAIGPKSEEFERPVFNLACMSFGLKLLAQTLREVFGDRFDARIQEMRDSLTEDSAESLPANMAEASRVIDTMSMLSRHHDVQYQLVKGEDYTLSDDGRFLDLKLRNAFAKYVKWQRSLGMESLFDNEGAFITGMSNYGGTVKKACPDNQLLFDSPRAIVYRLSIAFMDKENVDSFKS